MLPALGAAAAALTLAACGAAPAATPSPSADAPAAPGFPRTVASCGVEATLAAPPQRIVTIKSSATEMVLALGAGDRLVGTAFADGEPPAALADAAATAPVLAEKNPAPEAVLELEPDLVYAGWESNLSADGAGERSMYADLGIATYVSPAACKAPTYQPDKLTFDLVFDEITEAGRILGEEDAAARLVADQRAELAAVAPSDAGLSALWYSSGEDAPYVGAGIGAPQMILEAVGLENVAADVADTWTALSWEAVAERAPDVIVLVDSSWNTAAHKIDLLEANPVTAALPAVRERRYLTVPFPATEAGVRNVAAVTDLAAQLTALQGAG
ncbi:putative F420-0 ABC transporter substrate-binding protein [Georgenia thermotolerans]|uniref:Putative F420-0 ABC transporter substrate-binding protein n=1 Tax=Georgenia thermotolerans TaxID=527326 RepID=A0A7J5UQ31_9MICO|nr:putative F420-0 ABC transporter substrate-binding protein [Georgenia thermotolerans]KAE8764341.1 putative F420-0 ABC transporter substrate-binding protein [Georgenia thermotolerans]